MAPRKSKRLTNAEKNKIVDEETQMKRVKRKLDNLERDNHQEDYCPLNNMPNINFKYNGIKTLPERRWKAKKIELSEYFKIRFRKTFSQLLDEELKKRGDGPNYLSACAPPSARPKRSLCEVCGYLANYTCTTCNVKFCSIKCMHIHKDTRCNKWVM